MSTTQDNIKLIEQATQGNMKPLLAKAAKVPHLYANTNGDVTDSGDYPDDDFWLQVMNAYGDGTLTADQFAQVWG